MRNNEPNRENGSTSELRHSAETNNDSDTNSDTNSSAANAAPLFDLTAFQRDLVRVLYEDGRPGMRIKEVLEFYYEKEVHHGRLYPNLATLIDKGLAEKGAIDRRTNEYRLTQRGRREWEAHCKWEREELVDPSDSNSHNGGTQ